MTRSGKRSYPVIVAGCGCRRLIRASTRPWARGRCARTVRSRAALRLPSTSATCVTSGDDSPYAELEGADRAAFRMLAVDPAAQGAGAGRALIEACIGVTRAEGK